MKELEKTRKRLRTLDFQRLQFPFIHATRKPQKFFRGIPPECGAYKMPNIWEIR
jgi:hypothetical protein